MRLQSYLLVGLAVVSAGATSLAWRQYQELIALRAEATDSDRKQIEARLAKLQAQNQALLAQLAARSVAPTEATGSAGDTGAGNAPPTLAAATLAKLATVPGESRHDAMLDVLAALADSAEFQHLLALQQRGGIDEKYAGLFRKLNLSPEQQGQLESMLANKQTAYSDALLAAHDQGLTGQDARLAAKAVAQATNQQLDASIKSLLGDQGYQQLQNYERTMPQRETVNQLAQRLSYTDAPLTPHQQDQLVQALASGSRQDLAALKAQAAATGQPLAKPPATMNAVPNVLNGIGVSASGGAVITPTGITKSTPFLSPQQASALQQLQEEQQAQLTLGKLLRAGISKPPAPAPAAANLPKNGKG